MWLASLTSRQYTTQLLILLLAFIQGQGSALAAPSSSMSALISSANQSGDAQQQYQLGQLYQRGEKVKRHSEKAKTWYYRAAKQGHRKAQTALGKMQLYGDGIAKNFPRARHWLSLAAKRGHPEAQFELGNLYKNGHGVQKQTSKARRWYQKAATAGYAPAQYALAQAYEKGIGAQKKLHRAIHWYEQAAKQDYQAAIRQLTRLAPQSPYANRQTKTQRRAIQKEIIRAKSGDSKAQHRLGMAYLRGQDVQKDNQKAFYWLHKAAKKNRVDAQYRIAVLYANGQGTEKNLYKSMKWLKLAAEKNHKQANILLNNTKSNVHIRQSPATSLPPILAKPTNSETIKLQTPITSVSPQKIFQKLSKAAQQGDAQAQYQLGNLYLQGKGTDKSITTGVHWLKKAAKRDIKPAITALKYLQEAGLDHWLEAEKGNAESQYQVAKMFIDAGQPNDIEKALPWLEKAAQQDNADAALALGKLNKNGTYFPSNSQLAFKWLKKSAELGNAEAQYQLSLLYKNGIGISSDDTLAQYWHQQSIKNAGLASQ